MIQNRQRLLACVLCTSLGLAQAEPLVVTIMAQESIPPKWVQRDGRIEGVCPEILTALQKVEPRLRFTGYDNTRSLLMIEAALESGKALAACALLDSPRRRASSQVIGKPLFIVRHRLAAAAGDNAVINNLDDLARLKPLINTNRGAAYTAQLIALGIEVDDSSGDSMVNLKKVLAGHGRFTYMNELSLGWFLQSESLRGKLRILPAVLKEEPIYFWMSRKAEPEAVRLVGRGLDKLRANGELARIYERWTHVKPPIPGSAP
ncbi:MAG: transporter substrate-binding domain-containing protein [Pseudomonadota bacterium]